MCSVPDFDEKESDYFIEIVHFLYYHRHWSVEQVCRGLKVDNRRVQRVLNEGKYTCNPALALSMYQYDYVLRTP